MANNHGNGHRYNSEDPPRAPDDPPDDYAGEVGGMSRRERRHALRDGIIDVQAQQMASLRSRRQAEPTSPVIVAIGIVVVAIVVLGLGGGLPKLLRGNDEKAPPGLLTPSLPAGGQTNEQDNQSDPSTETSSPSTTASISAPPVLTERPSAGSTAAAGQVADAWAREFYTRTPGAESYDQLVSKVEKYLTTELADSLTSTGDPTYEALRADGGVSSVTAVQVSAPRQGSAPVDTPTRISRLVNITIDMTGKHAGRINLPLLLTLVPENNQWVISDVNGGAGP